MILISDVIMNIDKIPTQAFSVSIDPINIVETVPNGTINRDSTATPAGHTGVVTYLWTKESPSDPGVTLTNETTATVDIELTGGNREVSQVVKLTADDDGTGETAIAYLTIYVQFGTPQ